MNVSPTRIWAAVRTRLRAAAALLGARGATRQRLAGAPIRRVLVVCYGNIYRSAYMGEYLRSRAGAMVEVRSGGFHRKTGRPSPPAHVAMCSRRGVSLQSHRSRLVEPADLEWADTIVLMDRHNWAALAAMGAEPAKLVWAGALVPGSVEIPDPYALGEVAADRILARLESAAQRLAEKLRAQSGVEISSQ